MRALNDRDFKILSELMKNSKTSDRQLAKKFGISQPTVTRRRAELERRRLLEYTAIPNLKELGFEIIAFTFAHYKPHVRIQLARNQDDLGKKIQKTLSLAPNIIFSSSGSGLGFQGISISIHKNYSEYIKFRRGLENQWGDYVINIDSFIVSVKGDNTVRFLTLKFLADYIETQGTK